MLMREKGFMIMEMILVITLAAIIILVGLQYYRNYNRVMQLELVAHDIATLRASLNRFYDALPCDGHGVLQNDLDVDLITQLDIPHSLTGRAPYVTGYHAFIVDSAVVTNQQKPVYMLEVRADIASAYLSAMSSLTQRFAATRYNDNTIYWRSLSNNSTTDPGSDLWDLNVSRDAFRNLKNSTTLSAGGYSHAYCAR